MCGRSIEELWEVLQEACRATPEHSLKVLEESLPQRAQAVLKEVINTNIDLVALLELKKQNKTNFSPLLRLFPSKRQSNAGWHSTVFLYKFFETTNLFLD